jgi:hypothetical protein
VKKAFLLAAGAAMQKYRDRLADQQEIVAALADIVMESTRWNPPWRSACRGVGWKAASDARGRAASLISAGIQFQKKAAPPSTFTDCPVMALA